MNRDVTKLADEARISHKRVHAPCVCENHKTHLVQIEMSAVVSVGRCSRVLVQFVVLQSREWWICVLYDGDARCLQQSEHAAQSAMKRITLLN